MADSNPFAAIAAAANKGTSSAVASKLKGAPPAPAKGANPFAAAAARRLKKKPKEGSPAEEKGESKAEALAEGDN